MACIEAGYNLGSNLNPFYDALDFVEFYNEWINPYLSGARQHPVMEKQFSKQLSKFRSSIKPNEKWGWKNPRSMLLLPFFNRLLPKMKFVHVIRDGRDMAYSSNQHLADQADILLGDIYRNAPPAVQSIALWQKANLMAAEYAEEIMSSRYFLIRFEDLCQKPASTLWQLYDFLGVKFEDMPNMASKIKKSTSIGRWRNAPQAEQAELLRVGQHGLRRFGYI